MTEKASYLPYGKQTIDDEDIESVVDVLKSPFLTQGPAVNEMESSFLQFIKAKFVVGCSSGTAALHLAVKALNIKQGDNVVVPTITFMATANVIRHAGANVVFADVDPETGLMTPDSFLDACRRVNNEIKCVIPVHFAGQTENVGEIYNIAKQYNAFLIEDACHALGTTYENNKVGDCKYSDIAAFSLHPVKNISAGEGGVVTCNDPELAQKMKELREHGVIRDHKLHTNGDLLRDNNNKYNTWYHEMHEPGFNYRISDIHAALATSQLKKIGRFCEKRGALVRLYDEKIASLKNIKPLKKLTFSKPCWHLYIVLIDFENIGLDRNTVIKELKEKNIGTQVHYIPVHHQPYYKRLYDLKLPSADLFYKKCLTLPLYPGMQTHDVERVVEELSEVVNK